jgi:hypothetical protein
MHTSEWERLWRLALALVLSTVVGVRTRTGALLPVLALETARAAGSTI